jgi:hypothetical protein
MTAATVERGGRRAMTDQGPRIPATDAVAAFARLSGSVRSGAVRVATP